ncbi:hypothetical protein Barb6_00843 [Bacteroidales bacterium Barb6]|nr:hypothetical protein Barb6_00843 [Bacteroidales bacterium Barb6]
MNKTVELLKKSKVFFLATNEGNLPKVRPFGAVAEINGKVYLSTANNKECFKQIIANPKVQIAAMLDDWKWLRISGTLKLDPAQSSREEMLKQFPLDIYKADDGIFEVLYFTEGTVEIYDEDKVESFEL